MISLTELQKTPPVEDMERSAASALSAMATHSSPKETIDLAHFVHSRLARAGVFPMYSTSRAIKTIDYGFWRGDTTLRIGNKAQTTVGILVLQKIEETMATQKSIRIVVVCIDQEMTCIYDYAPEYIGILEQFLTSLRNKLNS